MGNQADSSTNDSDSTDSSTSWKKGTTKEERVFVMGAMAKVNLDSDKSSMDSETCRKLVKKYCRSQKKSRKSSKKSK